VRFIQFQKYYILVSKSQTKLITSLQQKKYRNKEGLFVAEGPKVIAELIQEGLKRTAFLLRIRRKQILKITIWQRKRNLKK
jgi:hypothetical protein